MEVGSSRAFNARHPGESRDPVLLTPFSPCGRAAIHGRELRGGAKRAAFAPPTRHPCLFPRRPTARVTFLSGKVTKAIGAGHGGLANIRLARRPVASCARRAGANSHIPVLGHRALLPPGPAMLGAMRRRPSSLRHGHPWPALQCRMERGLLAISQATQELRAPTKPLP